MNPSHSKTSQTPSRIRFPSFRYILFKKKCHHLHFKVLNFLFYHVFSVRFLLLLPVFVAFLPFLITSGVSPVFITSAVSHCSQIFSVCVSIFSFQLVFFFIPWFFLCSLILFLLSDSVSSSMSCLISTCFLVYLIHFLKFSQVCISCVASKVSVYTSALFIYKYSLLLVFLLSWCFCS